MTAGWETKPLGETCEVLDKLRKPITKKDRIAGSVPYYGATGIVDYVEGFLFDEMLVLVGEDGAKWNAGDNTAFEISGKTWVNNHAHVLRPLRDEMLDQWLIYFLNFSDLSEYITGVTVPKLNQKKLRSIPIPVPPLEEQKRIVAVLDAAFEGLDRARAHTEANLQNARDLFLRINENLFASLSTRKTIDHLATVKGGKRLAKGKKVQSEPTPFPYISVKNFTDDGTVAMEKLGYITADVQDPIKNYIINEEDLYISIAGTIGKTGIVPKALSGANLTENAARLIFEEGVFNEFIYYFTLTEDFQSQAGLNTRTAAQPKLALKRLKTIEVPIVDLSLQKEISEKLSKHRQMSRTLQKRYKSKLADIDDLRQSLLQKAFAGELT